MTRRFFSGNSLDQAVMTAARHYGIDPEELAYRQIEKRHGFLRTRKAVMIAVDPERPTRGPETAAHTSATPGETVSTPAVETEIPAAAGTEPPAPAGPETPAVEATAAAVPEPTAAAEPDRPVIETHRQPLAEVATEAPKSAALDEDAPIPRETEVDDDLLDAAERATQTLMRFAGIEGEASAESGNERVEVEVEGPDASLLVVENGKGLLAIQHLLPRMLRGMTGRSSFVRVDSQGFHQQRKERLEALAHKEAEVVSRDGSSRTLPPMAPDERRLVHLALKDVAAVVTESRGTGLHKRVVIRPAPGDGGRHDVEARHGF